LCAGDRDLISNQVVAEYRLQFNQLTGMSLSAVPMRQAQLPRLSQTFVLMEHDCTGVLDGIYKAPSVAVNEQEKNSPFSKYKGPMSGPRKAERRPAATSE